MHFLLLNQFYPPDPAPTGQYLHDLARALVERGHRVRVLCSRNGYDGVARYPVRETLEGVHVDRLWATGFGRRGFVGKLADYATFYGSVLWSVLFSRERPDLIVSLTTPPWLGLLARLGAWKAACPRIHWIMDLYPDVLFAHGLVRPTSIAGRLMIALTRLELRHAAHVVSLGPCMSGRVRAYCESPSSAHSPPTLNPALNPTLNRDLNPTLNPALNPTLNRTAESSTKFATNAETKCGTKCETKAEAPSCWLPLWSDPRLEPWTDHEPNPIRERRHWDRADLVLLYSGNMGLGHRFAEFLEAARQLGPTGPRWVFSGGGKRRAELESFTRTHPEARIELLDYVPQSELRAHLCAGDIHLASLDPSWQGSIVPSKLQASFAVGRPVLFVGGLECETASWIQESGGGWIVPPGDIGGILRALQEATDPAERRRRGAAALAYARSRFDLTTICRQWMELLENIPGGLNRS